MHHSLQQIVAIF